MKEVSLRCTSLVSDGGHPLAVTGEGVNLYNLVALLQGPYLHPQLAAQLQQRTLCTVAHPHKLICMPTEHLKLHRRDHLASTHDHQQEKYSGVCTADVSGMSTSAAKKLLQGPNWKTEAAGYITYLTPHLASRWQLC